MAFSASSSNKAASIPNALSFVTEICGKLKEIKRQGWVMRRVPFPESDSDHMHRCALCAMLVGNDRAVDTTKLLKMALTHDLCEALAGDVTPFCGVTAADKFQQEDRAMQQIRQLLLSGDHDSNNNPLGEELYALWKEYEEQETLEAIYCKDIDKFEMVVQAFEYETKYLKECPPGVDPLHDLNGEDPELPSVVEQPLRRFFQTTRSSLKTTLFRDLDQELRQRRQTMLESKGWKVTESEQQRYDS